MNQILILISFYCVCVSTLSPKRDDKWPPKIFVDFHEKFHADCVAESGTTAESIQQFSDGDVHDDPTLKCYMKCLLVRAGTLDETGRVNPVPVLNAIQTLSDEDQMIMLKMGSKCAGISNQDLCEEAFLLNKCLKESDPVHYFIL